MVPEKQFSKPSSFADLASRLAGLGYFPLPIPKGSKGPSIVGWDKLRLTTADAPRYFTESEMLVGALHVNLACFDIDVYDAALADEIITEGFKRFPGALERIGAAPKSAIVLRLDEPGFKIHNTEKHHITNGDGEVIEAQVEVRTLTGQMVVYGKHPDTGQPYRWPRGELWETPRADLPPLTQAAAQDFRDWCNTRIRQWAGADVQSALVIDIGEYRVTGLKDDRPGEAEFLEALNYVPASLAHESGWRDTLMGIHAYFSGSARGLDVAKGWSSADPRYSPQEVEAKWRSFEVGKGVGYRTVLHIARQHGLNLADLSRKHRPQAVVAQRIKALSEPAPKQADATGGLADWAFLSADNEFYNVFTGEGMTVSAFNLAMSPITPSIEVDKPNGETASKKFPASKTLIEFQSGKVVAHTMYRPDISDLFFSVDGIGYVNSYLPHTVPDAAPDWRANEAWKTCQDHIENILKDDAATIVKWMAHNVQWPGRKILWSPIIVGVQGDGKTTLSKIMQAAMGRANVGPVSPEAMFSDFTGWAEGSCVKILEEIRVHGNSRHNAMNKLKPLITNDSVEVVRKGKDGKQIANVTNYMALTNHMDALALDEGDRRWGVFKTRFASRKAMLAEIDDAYWSKLHSAIDSHPDVVRGWLLSIDLSGFNRVVGPETSAHKRLMIEATRSPSEADVCEALALGGFGVGETVAATDCINQTIQNMGSRPLNTSALANIMRDLGWEKYGPTLKWKSRNRRVYYRSIDGLADAAPAELSRLLRTKLDATDDGFHVET